MATNTLSVFIIYIYIYIYIYVPLQAIMADIDHSLPTRHGLEGYDTIDYTWIWCHIQYWMFIYLFVQHLFLYSFLVCIKIFVFIFVWQTVLDARFGWVIFYPYEHMTSFLTTLPVNYLHVQSCLQT